MDIENLTEIITQVIVNTLNEGDLNTDIQMKQKNELVIVDKGGEGESCLQYAKSLEQEYNLLRKELDVLAKRLESFGIEVKKLNAAETVVPVKKSGTNQIYTLQDVLGKVDNKGEFVVNSGDKLTPLVVDYIREKKIEIRYVNK